MKLWVRAESLDGLPNNAGVSVWADESGGGHDLVQANAAFRPSHVVNLEGLPAVSFDGVNDVLATAGNVLITDRHTILIVGRPAVTGNQDWLGTGGVASGDVLIQIGASQGIRGHVWRGASLTANDGLTDINLTAFALMEQEVNAGQMFLRVQGAEEYSGAVAGVAPGLPKPITLGSRSSGYFFQGLIRALLVFEGNPAVADLARVRDYLVKTYGLTVPYPAVPRAPFIDNGTPTWDGTVAGWVDNYIEFSFYHASFPVATMEVWEHDAGNALRLVATIPSTDSAFTHTLASQTPGTFYYSLRYRNGSMVGPFSDDYPVEVDPEGG